MQAVEPVYHEYPDDPVIAAYYADCLSMMGKDSLDTSAVFGSAINAIKLFDEILEKHPKSIEARLLRICHSWRLPEVFFKRTVSAVKDLEYLVEAYETEKATLPPELYFKLLYMLGKSYGRMGLKGENDAVWNKLLSLDCGEPLRKLAEKAAVPAQESIGPVMSENKNPKELFKKAKQLHDLGVNGDENAALQAKALLEDLHGKNPEVPIIEGYYGSSLALAGKNASEAQDLFGSAIKGMKHLNHAVEADPQNPKLRYLRACLSYNLPEAFFHLGEKTCSDFGSALQAWDGNHGFLSDEQFQRMLYELGSCCRRLGKTADGEKAWNRLKKDYPKSLYTRKLNELEEGSGKE